MDIFIKTTIYIIYCIYIYNTNTRWKRQESKVCTCNMHAIG